MDGLDKSICVVCKREPWELEEYVEGAKEEGFDSAEDYCRNQEGTWNPDNSHFYCTDCYIKIGMPLGVAP